MYFFKTITRLLLCVFLLLTCQLRAPASKFESSSELFGVSTRELYDLLLDATEEQLLAATARTEKYHKAGNYLAKDIQRLAEQAYNKIDEEQQKLITELAQTKDQLAQARTEIEELKTRAAEIPAGAKDELVQLRAVNKFLGERVAKLENNFQEYLKELIKKVEGLHPEAAAKPSSEEGGLEDS